MAIANELASVSASGIAIVDAVKLLEGGSSAICQSKWPVICPEEHERCRDLLISAGRVFLTHGRRNEKVASSGGEGHLLQDDNAIVAGAA